MIITTTFCLTILGICWKSKSFSKGETLILNGKKGDSSIGRQTWFSSVYVIDNQPVILLLFLYHHYSYLFALIKRLFTFCQVFFLLFDNCHLSYFILSFRQSAKSFRWCLFSLYCHLVLIGIILNIFAVLFSYESM